MSFEADLVSALGALCDGRCYPDLAPINAARPYITYQQVGGDVVAFLEGGPSTKRNGRVQVNVWHDTRLGANTLMRQVEDTLQSSPWYGEPIGALIARYDEQALCRGAQQDFSLWWS